MPYSTPTLSLDSDLAILTFNRPEKRNATSPEMIEELLAALDEIEGSPAGVAILTGAGQSFCSGMDLQALRAMAPQGEKPAGPREPATEGVLDVALRMLKGQAEGAAEHGTGGATRAPGSHESSEPAECSGSAIQSARIMARMFRRIHDFPKPLIAAVNGAAIAGGCGIATFCDFTLAAPEAKFGYTEVRIGFIPAIVSIFLVRQIGEKRARDLLLTGRIIDSAEAYHLGLVTEIVPAENLMARARNLAGRLLENSPTSLAYTKRLLREFNKAKLDDEIELALEENARIRSTPDFREGLNAFLEKRKPVWSRAAMGPETKS